MAGAIRWRQQDVVYADQLVPGGLQGDGAAGQTRVDSEDGFDGVDHCHAEGLVEGEQSPHLLLESA
ncbi:hypothetical protein ABZ890_45085 [Streptomyces sp. NPDC046984]|uniref:hypothetical protein n=1 Tax=Streptomyces sp. NPDC046984 TaxID=3155138 RepID=UPI0033C78853